MRQIVIDTDGRREALEAIALALGEPGVRVRAVTTVGAGLTAAQAAGNVLTLQEMAGEETPGVYGGLDRPLVSRGEAGRLEGHVRLEGPVRGEIRREHGVDAILRYAGEGETELVAMGPLSNAALAFAKDRVTMGRLKRIWLLGGMIFHGDVGPMSEYSFRADPEAADLVLKSRVEIVILPLEVGSLRERMELVLHPERIQKTYPSYTRIELEGELTRGANINDVRDRDRKEFLSQGTVLYPFNCTLVADNAREEITMEV